MSNIYISKALRKDIPSDAILLTRAEALARHWDLIKGWRPRTDTWPFQWGIGTLTGITSVTALTMINHYRAVLKLNHYGKVTLVLPSVVVPTIASIFAHVSEVTQSILLVDDCPLCIQTKAAALQVGLAVVFPVATSPILAIFYAASYGTYNVPPLRQHYIPELFRLWVFMVRKLKNKLPIAIAVNGIAATVLTYFEADSFYKIQKKVHEREENFRKSFLNEMI